MNREFEVHILNDAGKAKARHIAYAFDACLAAVDALVVDPRCKALMRTKMEEACFFAKKGMASADFNQDTPSEGADKGEP